MSLVDGGLVARAVSAATSLASTLGLPVKDAVVIQNSNKLALRLLPCDVFARIAPAGQEVAALEVQLAEALAALDAPIAALDPRVEARVYEHDGFAVSFWAYHSPATDPATTPMYASALHGLHAAMQRVDIEAPHFTQRIAEAESLVTSRDETPALLNADRTMLLDALRGARQAIRGRLNGEQLLHGEPHPGNLLNTSDGPLFIDFETCCHGPVEFDLAHAPEEVCLLYPGVDQILLQECRRLVLAMVAAWRWDVRDEFPDGRRDGRNILGLLRDGPPWPTLGAMSP